MTVLNVYVKATDGLTYVIEALEVLITAPNDLSKGEEYAAQIVYDHGYHGGVGFNWKCHVRAGHHHHAATIHYGILPNDQLAGWKAIARQIPSIHSLCRINPTNINMYGIK